MNERPARIVALAAGLILGAVLLIRKNVHEAELKTSAYYDNGNCVVMSVEEIPDDCRVLIMAGPAGSETWRSELSGETELQNACCVILDDESRNEETLQKIAETNVESINYKCGYFGIEPLTKMQSLKKLSFDCPLPEDIHPEFPSLTNLWLSFSWRGLGWIADVPTLKELRINDYKFENLSGIEKLTELEILNIDYTSVTDIRGVEKLTKLQVFSAAYCKLNNASFFAGMDDLEVFDVHESNIRNISALENKQKLRAVNLSATKVDDISALVGDEALESLNISGTAVRDISQLRNPGLKTVYMYGCDIEPDELEEFLAWADSNGTKVFYGGEKIAE